MACFNGLSEAQQTRLVEWGNLEFGYQPEGECRNGAEMAIETQDDVAPGPRFYCRSCAIEYLRPYDHDVRTTALEGAVVDLAVDIAERAR